MRNQGTVIREIPLSAPSLIFLSGLIFVGLINSLGAAERERQGNSVAQGSVTIGQALPCGHTYREVARGMSCQGLFDFQKRCRGELNTALVTTALRLRCPDELFEQKYKAMQESFAKAEQRPGCAVMSSFVEQYALDFELADAPEMEKANGLRIRLCEREMRDKEIAIIEASLRDVLGKNDCVMFRAFEKQNALKLTPDQSGRLASAAKPRCEIEQKANAALRSCLNQSETSGNFCGGAACFQTFRSVLPQDTYFTAYRDESQRQDRICKEFAVMRTCFNSDECGGERCSLPSRLAIANGPLIGYIQKLEQEASRICTAKQERERIARLEAERDLQRRQDELRAQTRRNQTIKLSLCNHSNQARINVSLAYYDYDESNWVGEGWWIVSRGNCSYIGDRFKRGTVYFYAYGPGERSVWSGDFGLCVEWSRFRRLDRGKYSCDSSRHRKFRQREINASEYSLDFT